MTLYRLCLRLARTPDLMRPAVMGSLLTVWDPTKQHARVPHGGGLIEYAARRGGRTSPRDDPARQAGARRAGRRSSPGGGARHVPDPGAAGTAAAGAGGA